MDSFAQFLQRNSVVAGPGLPVVHTTRAQHLRAIRSTGVIKTTDCDVFLNEKLSYFFVGRPAYKPFSDSNEPEYWELPSCLIFSFEQLGDIRRIYPFDSGAFSKGAYPSYMGTDRDFFEVGGVDGAPQKIVGAFFGTAANYLSLKPKESTAFATEFSLSVLDSEIHALHKLARARHPGAPDDRRFTIEIQKDQDLDLSVSTPLAVVAPNVYYDEPNFRNHVENVWGATFIGYPTYPLSSQSYYGMIYERVFGLYQRMGLL